MTPLFADAAAAAVIGVHPLATTNAVLNALSTVLLLTGWVFIKRGNVRAHRAAMVSALVLKMAPSSPPESGATTGTTSHPRRRVSSAASTSMPRSAAASPSVRAMTVGRPISITWLAR